MVITYTIGDSLYVNVTNQCTNSCEFCIRNNGDSVGDAQSLWLEKEPSKEEILMDILSRDLYAFNELVFCGYGEPLCRHDDIVFICQKVKEASSIKIRINTNGHADLINGRSTAQELAGLIDIISISLNAADAKSYQSICHSDFGEDAFKAVLDYTADCMKYIPKVMLTVVDVISPAEIERCRIIAEGIGAEFRVRTMIE
jgi:radical SAM enzyme (TIGR04100 family)